jgi:hypothetical protein
LFAYAFLSALFAHIISQLAPDAFPKLKATLKGIFSRKKKDSKTEPARTETKPVEATETQPPAPAPVEAPAPTEVTQTTEPAAPTEVLAVDTKEVAPAAGM